MKYLVYLSPAERQLWAKDGQGWQRVSGEPNGPVWVVSDLVEESFAAIKTPRLFGRDRTSYIARQLATRYPDTPYRTFLTPDQEGDLIGKIAPTRHILLGVDAAERLNAELDGTPNPVAGVWPVSMLLALLGRDRDLPADLFVVLPGPGTLRIVFLKNRTPVLTRLTLTPNQATAQVDEITRTLRHLENTQVVKRDRQIHPVLLLGDPGGFEAPMAAANLQRVSLPSWEKNPPENWHFPLFDLALKSPAGQVAPIARRIGYLSTRLSKAAGYLAVLLAFVGIAAAGGNLSTILALIGQNHSIVDLVQKLNLRIAEVDSEIGRFGVAPELVRAAIGVHQREIASVPALEDSLRLGAHAIRGDPALRLNDFQARLILPSGSTCGVDLTSEDGMKRPEATSPGVDKRRIEIGFEVAVPGTYGPRDRAQTVRMVSGILSNVDGLTFWKDANKDTASGSLRGGSVVGVATRLGWCLTVPGAAPESAEAKGPAKS